MAKESQCHDHEQHQLQQPQQQLYFLTDRLPISLYAAKVLGIISTAVLCGHFYNTSATAAPALLQAPPAQHQVVLQQWTALLKSDEALAPAVILLGTLTFGCLALKEPRSQPSAKLYAAAALSLCACIPFSMLLLDPISKDLGSISQHIPEVFTGYSRDTTTTGTVDSASDIVALPQTQITAIYTLMAKWATANLGRASLTGLSSVLATIASVKRSEIVAATIELV
ncbi:hypothetical protein K431DRAFT_286701 [Polychaeton citri CBS 116435]|uniref:Uncharacterized protein n=1 Tax=Polychaeton citri CBS 116435 TaxID=1314669 RepID=A0A9P4Q6U9_9PEZI|nr:hypothetical protein K431DRAFT_286701 [Polychaeton citri CBS 116435]